MTLRRMKTYTGGLGYVYQYYFVGKRAALAKDPSAPSVEFVFDVTSDRKITFSVSVFLPEDVLQRWSVNHRRPLTEAEQYGSAKMRLFQGFDEVEAMMAEGRRLLISLETLEQLLSALGVQ